MARCVVRTLPLDRESAQGHLPLIDARAYGVLNRPPCSQAWRNQDERAYWNVAVVMSMLRH